MLICAQVEGEPQGLCVSRGNLYITCSGSRLVKVCTGDGLTCLRSFKLQQDVSSPWHAIPLPDSERFVVSHGLEGGRLHRLCVVDNNGKVYAERQARSQDCKFGAASGFVRGGGQTYFEYYYTAIAC